MLPTKVTSALKQAESKEIERDIPLKWKPRQSRGSSAYIRQNSL